MAARGVLNLAQASEAALIVAAQGRDQAAFGELVKRRQGWARALLRRMCAGNAAEADDLAQDSFVKAWDHLGNLENPAAFAGWFRRIAVTTFLMAKGARRRSSRRSTTPPQLLTKARPLKPPPAPKSIWSAPWPGFPTPKGCV